MSRFFEFDVALQEIQPRIRRRFLIRTTSTFAQLHKAIHQSYGWWDNHLWEFRLPTYNGRPIAGLPTDEDFGRPTPDAREVNRRGYFRRRPGRAAHLVGRLEAGRLRTRLRKGKIRPMSRVKRGRRRDSIEQAMELALRLGDFIGYGASWEFVSRLEEGSSRIFYAAG